MKLLFAQIFCSNLKTRLVGSLKAHRDDLCEPYILFSFIADDHFIGAVDSEQYGDGNYCGYSEI